MPPRGSSFVALSLLFTVGGLFGAPPPETTAVASSEVPITLLITSGLGGQLVNAHGQTMALVAAAVRHETAAAEQAGRRVLVFDAGRTVTPYAESRHEGGKTTLAVLEAAGCQAFAPDAMDFSLGKEAFEHLATHYDVPILLPFLAAPHERSDRLPHEIRVDLPDGPVVRLISLFDPIFRGDLEASDHAARPEHLPEELGSPDQIDIVIVHSSGAGKETRSRELTWEILDDPRGADLLYDPDMGHDMKVDAVVEGEAIHLIGRARERNEWRLLRIDARAIHDTETGWRIVDVVSDVLPLDPNLPVDPELAAQVRQSWERFHLDNDIPLIAGGPTDYQALRLFALEAMREATRAEVAVLNRGALRPVADKFFTGERLTNEAVLRMLSIDQRIQVIELTGRELQRLASSSAERTYEDGTPRSDSLEFLGFEDGRVNGRRVVSDEIYRVVTNQYLLSGGDGHRLLAQQPVDPNVERLPELRRDIVIPRLAEADEPFADLSRRSLWRYGVDRLALIADGVETDRDPAYRDASDSRASADDSVGVRARLQLRLDLDRTRWRWENRFKSRFGLIEIDDTTREIEDELTLDSSLVYLENRFWGGSPFASLTIESELRRNEGSDGDELPRRLEETLAAGLTWELEHWKRIRLGAVLREYPNLEQDRQLGFKAEAEFAWPALRSDDQRGFEMDLLAEHLEDDLSEIDRFDLEARLLFPLVRDFAFTPGFNYYWFADSRLPGAASFYRISFGLSYRWAGKHQSW